MIAVSYLPRSEQLARERASIHAGLRATGYQVQEVKTASGRQVPGQVAVVWNGAPPRVNLQGQTVLVAENGYWTSLGRPYVALSVGGHNGSGKTPRGDTARLKALGIPIQPWRTEGKHILVCPSRGMGFGVMAQPADWPARVVEVIRRHTDRPIRVRPHPGNWKLNPPKVSIEDDLAGAWCCVIWASAAGVRSLVAGVPVIRCAPHWIAAGADGTRLDEVESPPTPDRTQAFANVASAQWSLDEIASGEAVRAVLA